MGRRDSFTGRARYWFDATLARGTSALVGWLALGCLIVVFPVSAVLVWTDPHAPASRSGRLVEIWRLTGETLRLGGATGPLLRVLLSVLLALVALVYVSTLVGLITTGLTERLTALRRGRSTVIEQGHSVVLGWSEQVFTVVSELVAANANQRYGAVAVLADRNKTAMEEALRSKVGTSGRTRLICRSGPPADPALLALTNPGAASAVLVLPHDDPSADPEVVKTLLALRSALGDEEGPPVVAAVRDDRYRLAASLAAGARGIVLESDAITARLIVQSARRPGLSLVYRDLLDFEGDEFYLAFDPALTSRSFGDTLLAYATSSVVGLLRDGRPLLNPPAQTLIGPGDRLIVITRDDDTARLSDCSGLVDESVMTPWQPTNARPERLLILGWNRRASLIVDQLGRYAAYGSAIAVVADRAEVTAEQVRHIGAPFVPRLTVTFRPGDVTRPETLRCLEMDSYDSVVVLGPDPVPGQQPDEADNRTLVTLLVLQLLEQESGRELPVVTEMTDDRNRTLAPVSPGADVIISGKLIGLLMAQISQNRHLAAVFEELFSPTGSQVHLRPAASYVLPDCEASFATVVAAARQRGECAIGYRRHDRATAVPDHGVRINPDKNERRCWTDRDEVVVIAQD
ncbi:CASTOR/POLLUX-related putative ion channel [Streptomyces europaeiscabiei]|uniref:CASTOR/POLLUX-related putative ion channel n=1 Tax=Streptomyces europaeiscabiei TaxID=146819 RepID=UPI0029BAFB6F|nr:NAD-binding protein [Streptomyces europaeiscabiei]MDX3582465.1 NAD-binding protein [Streptomyces europaeiscabiei]MDX3611323.1 NAD-binding protein [Streptomyces europaeiscabiei]WUD30875.1 NAD-binding protein [Streptomyces europaeiscabiei]